MVGDIVVNQRDIAKLAGVSSATVSRVVNSDKKVSPKTMKRVLSIIKEHGYVQNAMARDLRMSNSRTIGYLVPDIKNPFFTSMLNGFQEMCFKQGYDIIFENADDDPEKEKKALDTLLRYRVAGLLAVFVNTNNQYIEKFINMGIPIVMIDRARNGIQKTDYLSLDNIGGMEKIVNYLADLGHKRIAFIGGPKDITPGYERANGFKLALKNRNIEFREEYLAQGGFSEEGGYEATERLIRLVKRPTAIIGGNNLVSMGAYKAFVDNGIQIPQELSFISFDDFPLAGHLNPPITVLNRPMTSMGHLAAELLLQRIAENKLPDKDLKNVVLPAELTIRNSCAAIENM